MKWFYDMKIGTKLMAGFALVGSITAIVGYMGISNMGKINVMADQMYQKELLGVRLRPYACYLSMKRGVQCK